jgi:glycosyltransferase involved in cell wall biosynthesis
MNRVATFIVQTDIMKEALIASYSSISDRITVVNHPPPSWLLNCKSRDWIHKDQVRNLRLIYPAAEYPHKNHSLLGRIKVTESEIWPVEEILLTVRQVSNPAPSIPWINCVGHLSPAAMINAYGAVDALLFLSKKESYGFPLLEAMFLGLPVICPDLPYARTLCGNQAIYFDPDSIESLRAALIELTGLLSDNWKPNWSEQLRSVPKNWEDVASTFLDLAVKPTSID